MTHAIGKIMIGGDENEDLESLTKFATLATTGKGKSVYHKKIKPGDVDYRICRIHFFYFKVDNGKLIARHYFHVEKGATHANWTDFIHEVVDDPIPVHPERKRIRISTALEKLLKNARKKLVDQDPKPKGSVNAVAFKGRSFLAYCFDHADWSFPDDKNASNNIGLPAVYFSEDGGMTPNHSFFDGHTMTANDGTPIFYMVNHAKRNDQDNDLEEGDAQPIKYSIVVNVPMTGGEKLAVIFDPGGTNLGPPDPP